ncbi:MAG TPA: amidase [Xanthobacteraceae bacterium]|jgi:aspartyl-tRNA(Asn)/glutamyl-tRNA(Gln) amidotransferase subunit A|nr:amidase [Xanthobacteraceae bacterium]
MKPQSCRDRLEQALLRIADPSGEGARACLTVYPEAARTAADAADARTARGTSLGPLDGVLISIKDLFDVAGEPTRAGSKILAEEAPPATADATVVQRLRAAGAVIVAKTNMSEFAFSGIGANPHFGTPGNPRDRKRVPGGSSSGAPITVIDGMSEIAIGTDTGGSVRIPAGLCGLVGFKPSRQRVPTDGAFPLSKTLDSIGPIGKSVTDCAKADAVMAGETFAPLEPIGLAGLRLGVAVGLPLDRLDDTVAKAFSAAMSRLSSAGMNVTPEEFALFDDMVAINNRGGISPPEAYIVHRDRMKRRAADIDPNVRARIERGCAVTEADYADMMRERTRFVAAMDERLKSLDLIAMPTTSIVAPTIAEVADRDVFSARNAAALRNTSISNFFDLCAISLPIPDTALPVGLMLVARNGQDRMLLRIADAVMQQFGG